MKKMIIALALLLPLGGCGAVDRATAKFTGKPAEVCVDNVIYLQFTSGTTVKRGVNSLVVTCG